jgi:CHAD domain-containing protein
MGASGAGTATGRDEPDDPGGGQMTQVVMENERKFELDERVPIPELAGAMTDLDVELLKRPTVELRATYFDTADLRLLRSGATLRCRRGGADAGWHRKMPTGQAHVRTELRRPLGDAAGADAPEAIPAELVDLAFARLRGAALEVVAELRTLRTVTEVRDRSGAVLVEVADDLVVANPAGEPPLRWREVEVEESPGGLDIARRIAELLVDGGARPDEGGPKLARALGVALEPTTAQRPRGASMAGGAQRRDRGARTGHLVPRPAGAGGRAAGKPARPPSAVRSPVVAAVLARLAEQAEALALQDLAVRRDQDDSVHQMRVASRRLTSALTTFAVLLDSGRASHLCAELKWIARLLGSARDAEVMHEALEKQLAALPSEQVLGPVRTTIADRLIGAQAVAGAELAVAMRSQRYAAALDELQDFVTDPPLTDRPERQLARLALRRVRRDLEAVGRQMADASRRSGLPRELSLHEARKRAKRARYALETIEPAYGKPAQALVARYEGLQTALGEHHDAFVISALLREEGARAGVRAGENGYTYGLLAGMQRCRAEAGEAAAWRAFKGLERRKRPELLR